VTNGQSVALGEKPLKWLPVTWVPLIPNLKVGENERVRVFGSILSLSKANCRIKLKQTSQLVFVYHPVSLTMEKL